MLLFFFFGTVSEWSDIGWNQIADGRIVVVVVVVRPPHGHYDRVLLFVGTARGAISVVEGTEI
jgi:hypothetical protein